MENAFCLIAPVAIVYSFNAFRKVPQRVPARIGLGVSIVVALLFGLVMSVEVCNLVRVLRL